MSRNKKQLDVEKVLCDMCGGLGIVCGGCKKGLSDCDCSIKGPLHRSIDCPKCDGFGSHD